jgi:queuine tRNA-ribosyltransferase
VQGGRLHHLRKESAEFMANMDFDGYGIGGALSKADLLGTLEIVNNILPPEKPRHLLGIGEPEDMFIGVAGGIDTFDCVLPTKNGRNGTLFTHHGKVNIHRTEFQTDSRPIDENCDCMVCKKHTRAYIHHLFRSNEMLGPILASMHNVRFLTCLVDNMRQSILEDRFEAYRDEFMKKYTQ